MFGSRFFCIGRAALGCALALAASTGVLAQERIENVTVWAQKRAAPVQDVPIAIATLTADDLSMAGIDDVDDVARQLPFFELQRSASTTTTNFRIRRIGNIGNIPTFEPAIGLFVDGALRSRSFLGAGDLLDVQRVEVLAGPQSTLYGKSTSGGSVQV
jgi:iron complex outermembrane recepter protein